jgi:hypothetical protein
MFIQRPFDPNEVFCNYDEVFICGDHNQGMYCHLICALVQVIEIVKIDSLFASTVVTLICIFQSSLHEICDDIR